MASVSTPKAASENISVRRQRLRARLRANNYAVKFFVLTNMLIKVEQAIGRVSLEATAIETDLGVNEAPLTIAVGNSSMAKSAGGCGS